MLLKQCDLFPDAAQGAKECFPGEEDELALQKYARTVPRKNIFWFTEDGQRFVWREEIKYFDSLEPRGWASTRVRHEDRHYAVINTKQPLSEINRRKPKELSDFIAHLSESGWNLEMTHERHFSKFPQEIQDLIFEFALTPYTNDALQPITVVSNSGWEQERTPFSCAVRYSPFDVYYRPTDIGNQTYYPSLVQCTQEDEYGFYTELRRIRMRVIDATFLRVCSKFYLSGNRILYEKNSFIFPMADHDSQKIYSTPLVGQNEVRAGPINRVIFQIRTGVSVQELPGWAYYDHFIRFLHSIGPFNAAILKSLRFTGSVRYRQCRYRWKAWGDGCPDAIDSSLKIYLPFIKALCTSVETLVIYAAEDDKNDRDLWGSDLRSISTDDDDEEEDETKNVATALGPIVDFKITELETLKNLEVYTNAEKGIAGFARMTIDWIRERAAQNDRKKARLQTMQQQGKKTGELVVVANLECGFCKENHNWWDCYRLCTFCGRHLRYRTGCPNVH